MQRTIQIWGVGVVEDQASFSQNNAGTDVEIRVKLDGSIIHEGAVYTRILADLLSLENGYTPSDESRAPIAPENFVVGNKYMVLGLGDTAWASVGATKSPVEIGDIFTATAAGSGTGAAVKFEDLRTDAAVIEWTQGLEQASRELEITAIRGNFRFTRTLSNYMPIWKLSDRDTTLSTGADGFIPCYALEESDDIIVRDSNANVKIDGFAQVKNPLDNWERLGQWHWTIPQGAVFTSTMLISAGLESPAIPAEEWDSSLESYMVWRPNHISRGRN